tara:strand:+ start:196 stop:1947 length:1752 start_codon:yes stop_codon:yes gene_type:complete
MSASYWESDNIIRIGETQISVPSENGLSYTSGQRISLFVPPSAKFISGKDCYLEFDIKLAGGAIPTRLQLDPMGGSCVMRNLRIWDGTRGNLLEEINDYNAVVAMKYDYNADDSLRQTRALVEGGTAYNPRYRGNKGTSESHLTELHQNPYFRAESVGVLTTNWSDADATTAKCCVPIHSGIFGDRIFPCMMTNGLYLEIDLAPAQQVIKQLDSVNKNVRTGRNVFFDSRNGDAASDWTNDGVNRTHFYVSAEDNELGNDVTNFPFCVGETFRFMKYNDPADLDAMSGVMTISQIEADAGTGRIKVSINATNVPIGSGAAKSITRDWVMWSTAMSTGVTTNLQYTVSNVNLVVHEIQLDPSYEAGMLAKAREGKSIEIDIYSVTNHKHSVLSTERQVTYNIHSNNSRAKSLIIMPVDSTIYTPGNQVAGEGTYQIGPYVNAVPSEDEMDTSLTSMKTGYSGIIDGLTSSQFLVGGVLVPSRPVQTKKMVTKQSVDAYHLFELEKALSQAGIDPRSFAAFQSNFLIGRAFGLQSGVMDLRNHDLQVLLNYEDLIFGPTKNKVFNNFVFHVRKLIIRNGAVSVEH